MTVGVVHQPLKSGWAVHTACGKAWSGIKTAHCSACHLTFTTPTAFDKHRRRGACIFPDDAGLVRSSRGYECYGFPGSEEIE